MRILVVDDSPTIRTVVSTILERRGYDATTAIDGQDAFEVLESGEVKADLVLVDFVMPRMNGYQFCRAVRESATLAATPVVLMSAKGDRIRDQFVTQTGALDAITKPFDADALVLVIENALRKVNTARSSARLSQVDFAELESAPSIAGTVGTVGAVPTTPTVSGSALEGDLAIIPVGAILQLLQSELQTGVLVCTSAGVEIRTTFRAGAIDMVQSIGASDEFRLGRFFIEAGIVALEDIEAIIRPFRPDEDAPPLSNVHPRSDDPRAVILPDADEGGRVTLPMRPQPLGMELLATGKIDAAQLRAALVSQSSELLYEVLRWSEGRFELRLEPPTELADSARLGLPVASVVMEGFRRVDEWRVLERTLGSFDAVLARDDGAFGALDIESLPPNEKRVLEAVDGDRTVREVIRTAHQSSFDVCRTLVQFLQARVLRRRKGMSG